MIGKEILNIVRSLILEHLINPLCDKIILDTRESPNPVPLTDPVINGSNILSIRLSGIPEPLSSI